MLSISDQYDAVIISNQNNLYQSYMDYLYYSKYDPLLYRSQGGTISGGFRETHIIGKFQFRPIIWQNESRIGKTLYVGNVSDFPIGTNADMVFVSLDSNPTILVVSK